MKVYLLTAILALLIPFQGQGDTFLLVTEELSNGDEQSAPFPAREGLMSFIFDQGHIIFDIGALEVVVNWDELGFQEPLRLAREGLARFVIAARIRSQLSSEEQPPLIDSEASFFLLDADSSKLIGSGSISLNNHGREEELSYSDLLYALGEKIGSELLKLWDGQAL